MSVAPGNSFNSGLGLLAATGMPTICENSMLAFNEVTFGFTPHAGSSYYASRLPGEFGTFLLLSGAKFSGKDGIDLGLADKLIQVPKGYDDEVYLTLRAMDPAGMPFSRRALGREGALQLDQTPAEKELHALAEKHGRMETSLDRELARRRREFKLLERFSEPD